MTRARGPRRRAPEPIAVVCARKVTTMRAKDIVYGTTTNAHRASDPCGRRAQTCAWRVRDPRRRGVLLRAWPLRLRLALAPFASSVQDVLGRARAPNPAACGRCRTAHSERPE